MIDLRIEFDAKGLETDLKNDQKFISDTITSVIKQTTVYGLREIKTNIYKRSGFLRGAYTAKKTGVDQYLLWAGDAEKVKYADSLEFGSPAHTVLPKRKKFLTIPLRDDVRTKTGIKKGALDRLFKDIGFSGGGKMYSKIKGLSVRDVFDKDGIALARKAKIPAYTGSHVLTNVVAPRIGSYQENAMYYALGKAFQ